MNTQSALLTTRDLTIVTTVVSGDNSNDELVV